MEKIFHTGEKIFFTTLIICMISYLYFTILPLNDTIISIGCIFLIIYFGVNFFVGSISDLKIIESIIVGIMGSFIGVFLSMFALYAHLIMNDYELAIWIIKPYYAPTMSLVNLYFNEVTIGYPIILMFINISLVVIGTISRRIMNKFIIKI